MDSISITTTIIDARLLILSHPSKMLKNELPRQKMKHHRKQPTAKTKFLLVVSEA